MTLQPRRRNSRELPCSSCRPRTLNSSSLVYKHKKPFICLDWKHLHALSIYSLLRNCQLGVQSLIWVQIGGIKKNQDTSKITYVYWQQSPSIIFPIINQIEQHSCRLIVLQDTKLNHGSIKPIYTSPSVKRVSLSAMHANEPSVCLSITCQGPGQYAIQLPF